MISLRPAGFDELGLRRGFADRMLPVLVAAMGFLGALALAGWFSTAALSRHWREGASAALTVQVPRADEPALLGGTGQAGAAPGGMTQTVALQAGAGPGGGVQGGAGPGGGVQGGVAQGGGVQGGVAQAGGAERTSRLAAVVALLAGTPGVASVHALSQLELIELLKPWIGIGADRLTIPIPAVIAVRLTDAAFDLAPLSRRLQAAAPGTLVEDHGIWISRLSVLARSLQACAGLALLVVAAVAAAVVAVATRAGLSTRRDAIEIVHGLGAADRYIASRFAERATLLAAAGAAAGGLAALPVLLMLAQLAAPFGGQPVRDGAAGSGLVSGAIADALDALPPGLWLALPCVPAVAAVIGFLTAHGTVRRWLRRLP